MSQTNDMVPVQIVNRDGTSVVAIKLKLGTKVKLNDTEARFYNGIDKVMARIILQELMKHDSRSVQGQHLHHLWPRRLAQGH
ncbi:hypothetical protein ACGIJG_09380 [Lacticaseibacillus rhamnosus]|uniref:hypothetical protein n=1 Tax=Lacticaseibacillus rhamnosus TaxID=47715 RepID=UPI002FD8875D